MYDKSCIRALVQKEIKRIFDRDVFKSINREEFACFFNLVTNWEKIVGKGIALKTLPRFIHKNKLYISVSSPSWKMELKFLKSEILKKINMFSDYKITDIDYKIGAINISNLDSDDKRYEGLRRIIPNKKKIARVLEEISDDELKLVFKDLMAKFYTKELQEK